MPAAQTRLVVGQVWLDAPRHRGWEALSVGSSAAYGIAPHVGEVVGTASGSDEEVVYVAPLPDGPLLVLTGTATVIWSVAKEGGMMSDIIAEVARSYGVDPKDVATDVSVFVSELVERGLLTETT